MWRTIVALLFLSLMLTGCYWRGGKGIWVPAARPLPELGTATLTIVNHDDRPLFFYRSDGSEVLELILPPRGHWKIPNMQGGWWLRLARKPIHIPRIDVHGQVQHWPAGSRVNLERKWDYLIVVGARRANWTASRWVYPPAHWEGPAED